MYVYLKDGQHLRYISRVSLADGCYPCVHNVLHEHKELVEPAIWFKVLVLDSICIDCSKRMFYWTTGHIGKHDLRLWTTEYGDMEFYDYDDDFDELFLLARKLLTEKNAIADKDLAETQSEQNLLKLLHCYALPLITLQKGDIDRVSEALNKQIQLLYNFDEQLSLQLEAMQSIKEQMNELRIKLLPDLPQTIESGKCSREFLELFLRDIKSYQVVAKEEVDKSQLNVDAAKNAVYSGAGTEEELEKARDDRNHIAKFYMNLMMVRETVHNALRRSQYTEIDEIGNEIHIEFLASVNAINDRQKEVNELVQKKVLAVSVREALQSTLEQLKDGVVTAGVDSSLYGLRPTDVLKGDEGVSLSSKWSTLSEKVAKALNDDPHISQEYKSFCQEVICRCQRMLAQVDKESRSSTSDGNDDEYVTDGFLVIEEEDEQDSTNYLKRSLASLKQDILAHFKRIAATFAQQLEGSNVSTLQRKIWLCYERCFYEVVGKSLVSVYERFNQKQMEVIAEKVKKFGVCPVVDMGLTTKYEWWMDLFNESRSICLHSESHMKNDADNSEITKTDSKNETNQTASINIKDANRLHEGTVEEDHAEHLHSNKSNDNESAWKQNVHEITNDGIPKDGDIGKTRNGDDQEEINENHQNLELSHQQQKQALPDQLSDNIEDRNSQECSLDTAQTELDPALDPENELTEQKPSPDSESKIIKTGSFQKENNTETDDEEKISPKVHEIDDQENSLDEILNEQQPKEEACESVQFNQAQLEENMTDSSLTKVADDQINNAEEAHEDQQIKSTLTNNNSHSDISHDGGSKKIANEQDSQNMQETLPSAKESVADESDSETMQTPQEGTEINQLSDEKVKETAAVNSLSEADAEQDIMVEGKDSKMENRIKCSDNDSINNIESEKFINPEQSDESIKDVNKKKADFRNDHVRAEDVGIDPLNVSQDFWDTKTIAVSISEILESKEYMEPSSNEAENDSKHISSNKDIENLSEPTLNDANLENFNERDASDHIGLSSNKPSDEEDICNHEDDNDSNRSAENTSGIKSEVNHIRHEEGKNEYDAESSSDIQKHTSDRSDSTSSMNDNQTKIRRKTSKSSSVSSMSSRKADILRKVNGKKRAKSAGDEKTIASSPSTNADENNQNLGSNNKTSDSKNSSTSNGKMITSISAPAVSQVPYAVKMAGDQLGEKEDGLLDVTYAKPAPASIIPIACANATTVAASVILSACGGIINIGESLYIPSQEQSSNDHIPRKKLQIFPGATEDEMLFCKVDDQPVRRRAENYDYDSDSTASMESCSVTDSNSDVDVNALAMSNSEDNDSAIEDEEVQEIPKEKTAKYNGQDTIDSVRNENHRDGNSQIVNENEPMTPGTLMKRFDLELSKATSVLGVSEPSLEDTIITFEQYFGAVLDGICEVLICNAPMGKLQGLMSSLKKYTKSIAQLRLMKGVKDRIAAAVSTDDLLPFLTLILTRAKPEEAAKLYAQLNFISDLMGDFLLNGVHGNVLIQFQITMEILASLSPR